MLGAKLANWMNITEVNWDFHWLTSASFLLFFALFNSIFSLSADDMNRYWTRSISSFIVLALASAGLAYLFSSIPINDAASYRWIYIVLTFIYLIFLSIMRFMKKIVFIAQNEDRKMDEHK